MRGGGWGKLGGGRARGGVRGRQKNPVPSCPCLSTVSQFIHVHPRDVLHETGIGKVRERMNIHRRTK